MMRVCPLLERESQTWILQYAPSPWILRECLESGFVFLENPPGYAALEEELAWEKTYLKEAAARRQSEPVLYAISALLKTFRRSVLKRNKILRLALQRIRARIRDHDDDVHIVDIGCGSGNLLQEIFAQLPPAVSTRCLPYGIEISKALAGISSSRLQSGDFPRPGVCINDSALAGLSAFRSDFFDLVILSSFLEHEIHPLPLLRRCAERLQPGGSLIVKVPNYGSLNRVVRGRRWCGFRWPDHVNYFTPKTLYAMAERAGFIISRMGFGDRNPFSDTMYAVLTKPEP